MEVSYVFSSPTGIYIIFRKLNFTLCAKKLNTFFWFSKTGFGVLTVSISLSPSVPPNDLLPVSLITICGTLLCVCVMLAGWLHFKVINSMQSAFEYPVTREKGYIKCKFSLPRLADSFINPWKEDSTCWYLWLQWTISIYFLKGMRFCSLLSSLSYLW